jgi:lipopolysaccharide exporter
MSSSFLRQAAILTSGTVIAQVITVLSTPFVSRAYTAEEYGTAALFSSTATLVFTLAPLRYESQIVLPRIDSTASSLACIAAISTLAICALLLACLAVGGNELLFTLGLRSLGQLSLLAIFLGGVMSGIAICSNWLNRQKAYSAMAILRITQSLLAAILSLSLASRFPNLGLIIAQTLATIGSLGLALILTLKIAPIPRPNENTLETARNFIRAPMFLLPTAFLDVFSQQLPLFLIAAWFSDQLTGHYRMAYSLICLPAALVGTALGQVFFQHFASAWPDKVRAKRLLFRTWAGLFIVGAPAFFLVWIAGPQIFRFALGEEWAESGRIAALLAPMAFVNFISSPTSTSFVVIGLERYSLAFGMCVFIYRPLSVLVGIRSGSLDKGIIIMSLCEIICVFFYQALALAKTNRKHALEG